MSKEASVGASAIRQEITQWLERTGSRKPWVSPALGLDIRSIGGGRRPAASPCEADTAILAWEVEDGPSPAEQTVQALGLAHRTPVVLFASVGPWRAANRQRHLAHRLDFVELFGKQPEFALHHVSLDGESNGVWIASFRYDASALGRRDLERVRRTVAPRETLSACLIVRDVEPILLRALRSIERVADEVVVVDTGSADDTLGLVERFAETADTKVRLLKGTSPRWCFDCEREHGVHEYQPGHRLAGFETPRNQSIAAARGDWILWLDADETLNHPEALEKYLRPNAVAGYALWQHHLSGDCGRPLEPDLPVRVFRRIADGAPAGWVEMNGWPTYHPGLAVRFAGIIHEHPGRGPAYVEPLSPVLRLADVLVLHFGYSTAQARSHRVVRNGPLMAADRQKYPGRQLCRVVWPQASAGTFAQATAAVGLPGFCEQPARVRAGGAIAGELGAQRTGLGGPVGTPKGLQHKQFRARRAHVALGDQRIGNPARSPQKGRGPYLRSGVHTLKKAVAVLGSRALPPARSALGRELRAWQAVLIADLGGQDAVSTQQVALVEKAVTQKLICDSLDAYVLGLGSLVNKRHRAVWPIVRERAAQVTLLQSLLRDLGLERRAREVDTVEAIMKRLQGPLHRPTTARPSRPARCDVDEATPGTHGCCLKS